MDRRRTGFSTSTRVLYFLPSLRGWCCGEMEMRSSSAGSLVCDREPSGTFRMHDTIVLAVVGISPSTRIAKKKKGFQPWLAISRRSKTLSTQSALSSMDLSSPPGSLKPPERRRSEMILMIFFCNCRCAGRRKSPPPRHLNKSRPH